MFLYKIYTIILHFNLCLVNLYFTQYFSQFSMQNYNFIHCVFKFLKLFVKYDVIA
nr:MAG TPA: hypothetical protein [Caudoviricetes sp.]